MQPTENLQGSTKKTINSSRKTQKPAKESRSTTNNSSPRMTRNTDPGTRFAANLLRHSSKDSPLTFHLTTSILYLGAATGTTVSHLSDIITKGTIYAVETSPIAIISLLKVS